MDVYKTLGFISPAIKNGLIVSLPKERKYDNPLHQDIYNFHSERFIKIWAPLTEVNLENGSMKVFKGSHKKGFVEPSFSGLDYYPQISKNNIDGMNFEIFKFKPGPIVIFNPLVMHMSVPNVSKKSRFVIGCDIQDVSGIPNKSKNSKITLMKEISNKRKEKRKKINY